MTECERLCNEGVFSRDFFLEECRCDFIVTQERKKLWAILMDLLNNLLEICRRHDLRCYALYGTLLGAVRHKGFIPWDDDIDVGMPREDYEKLWEYRHEFKRPYFLQYPGKDYDYCVSFAKLRNSDTTQVSKNFIHHKFNGGILLDIFPLDLWSYENGKRSFDRIKELNLDNSNYLRQGHPDPDEIMKSRMACWSGRTYMENLNEIDDLARQFQNDRSVGHLSPAVCTIYPYEKSVFPREIFDKAVFLPFENIEVPVPVGYLEFLKIVYGKWDRYPPVVKRGTWHSDLILDTDKTYISYLKCEE